MQDFKEEFEDIARIQRWPHDVLNGEVQAPRRWNAKQRNQGSPVQVMAPPIYLEGIKIIVHPQTDPLWLAFDSHGRLTQLTYVPLDQYSKEKPGQVSRKLEFARQTQASIQTLLAGPETHLTVCRLLALAKSRYVPDLQVDDESGYWENRDEAALRRLMEMAR
jgi:hypothetical protein